MIRTLAALITVLVAATASTAAAADLGRLFLTPEQRQVLDQQRQLGLFDSKDGDAVRQMTVNGTVRRSSGKTTLWINGIARHQPHDHERSPPVDERLASAGLKVGESRDIATQQTRDLIGDGRIVVHHRH